MSEIWKPNPQAKLTYELVASIRNELLSGDRGIVNALSARHGVSRATISDIKGGRTWL